MAPPLNDSASDDRQAPGPASDSHPRVLPSLESNADVESGGTDSGIPETEQEAEAKEAAIGSGANSTQEGIGSDAAPNRTPDLAAPRVIDSAAYDAIIRALSATIESIKEDRQNLQTSQSRWFDFPKVVVTLILFIAAIGFAANFAHQFFTTSAVEDRVDDMEEDTKQQIRDLHESSERQIQRLQEASLAQMAELDDNSSQLLSTLQSDSDEQLRLAQIDDEKRVRELQGTHEQQLSELQDQVAEFEVAISLAIRTATTSNQALGLISLGHQQLSQGSSLHALQYGIEAQRLVVEMENELIGDSSTNVSLRESLGILFPSIEILAAEAHLQLGNVDEVGAIGERLLTRQCDCYEGHRYDGLFKLYRATGEIVNHEEREALMRDAVDALASAVEEGPRGTHDLVLLSAAEFDVGLWHDAEEHAREFIGSYPTAEESRSRLHPDVQIYLDLAEGFVKLATFFRGDPVDLTFVSGCGAEKLTIARLDGEIMTRILRGVELQAENATWDEPARIAVGALCATLLSELSNASTSCTPVADSVPSNYAPAGGAVEEAPEPPPEPAAASDTRA